MENFFRWFSSTPRRFPHAIPLAGLFYHPRKQGRVQGRPSRCNITFVLEGTGYFFEGQTRRVQPPMVFIQRADEPHDYAPDTSWEELSLVYHPDQQSSLESMGYLRRLHWALPQRRVIYRLIRELQAFGKEARQNPATVDRTDRLADQLLMESLSGAPKVRTSPSFSKVWQLRAAIDRHPERALDLGEWQWLNGMSESVFRREWQRLTSLSPLRYQQRARHGSACRLLVETDRSIGEIAMEVGYDDPLYFSRMFRKLAGCSPREYRRKRATFRTW